MVTIMLFIYLFVLPNEGFFNFFSTIIRGVATGRAMGAMPPPPLPNFNFRTKQGPKISVSNIRDIAFYGCSEIIQIRNFTVFIVYATGFGQFMTAFDFI